MSIIGAEDEDFENDLNDQLLEDQSPVFSSIDQLKGRPAHLLVFLHHVILQFDTAPLLCYLHADLLKNLSTKETKKYFVDFYNTFLDKGANLRVAVPPYVSCELDRNRPDLLSEEQQKRFTLDVQHLQAAEVVRQLEDFRQKRMMGMTPNEAELVDVENHYPTDRVPREMKEKSVAENLLDKMAEIQPSIVSDEDKCQTIFTAVVHYMKHLGVKTRSSDNKKSSKGGFFRNLGKTKRDESTKTKPRGGFQGITNWIGHSAEPKTPKSDTEVDKERASQDRKGSSVAPRGVLVDPAVPSFGRKSVSGGGPAPPPPTVPDIYDGGASTGVASSPDATHSTGPDPPTQPDGGDVSPCCLGPPTIGEPCLPADMTYEEAPVKERKVGRSESARVEWHSSRRRASSRAKQSRSRSDVDLQPPANTPASPTPLTPQHPHPADGPIQFPEGPPPSSPSPQPEEVEPRLLELEQDPPNWKDLAPSDALARLKKSETKRQEVINELFTTEHAHVRMLSVLQTVFSRPLEREAIMTSDEVATLFPSLDEIIDVHHTFYENLKKLRMDSNYIVKSIGTTLLNRFGGTEGEWFQKLTARFCSHQSWALDQIKTRQKRDPRFNTFIQEAESKPQCRRLQLKDIIPMAMQRLTKYPLLLENIAKNTDEQEEKDRIQLSAECCRKIVNHVNEEVKLMENLLALKVYQRKLDTSGLKPSNDLYTEYKNIDLTQKKMIFEGPLLWRVTKEKVIEVQCVLLGDLLVLLQRQDERMLLKCQSKSNIAAQDGKQMLSPIIKLDSVFLREVATDNKAFYVIFTWDNGAQIYELVAQTVGERKTWTEVIKTAVDDLKQSSPPMRLVLPPGGAGAPLSPTTMPATLSDPDNEGFKATNEQNKEGLLELKPRTTADARHSLIDYLSEQGFDLLGHSNSTQERVGDRALDGVMSLRRLLVGRVGLSETSEESEADACLPEGQRQEAGHEGEGGGGLEKLRRELLHLEEQVKKLQLVEEQHHRLQQVLSSFSLQGDNFH